MLFGWSQVLRQYRNRIIIWYRVLPQKQTSCLIWYKVATPSPITLKQLKNISYLLSQFRLKYIKTIFYVHAETKNGGMLCFAGHEYDKCCEWEPCLQCLDVWDSEHSDESVHLWEFWLIDVFIYPLLYHFSNLTVSLVPSVFSIISQIFHQFYTGLYC